MSGYFSSSGTTVEIGQRASGAGGGRHRVVRRSRPGAGAVHDSGGGVLEWELQSMRVRDNLGDAERWAYEVLSALIQAEPGEVGWEDGRGGRSVRSDALLVSGEATVSAYRVAELSLDWQAAQQSSTPSWSGAPAAPGTYAYTHTDQDYVAGGESLGTAGSMTLEAYRSGDLREVPRARGSRRGMQLRDAEMRLIVEADLMVGTAHLADAADQVARAIGTRPVSLGANGVWYTECVLSGWSPEQTTRRSTRVRWEFVQDLREGGVY